MLTAYDEVSASNNPFPDIASIQLDYKAKKVLIANLTTKEEILSKNKIPAYCELEENMQQIIKEEI